MRLKFDSSIPPEEYFNPLVQARYQAQNYWSLTKVKVIYLFSRYFGLLFQALLFFCMEAVMMLRVYALYNHSKTIGFILVVLFILEASASIVSPFFSLPESQFDAICTGEAAPKAALVFGLIIFFVQTAIALLTIVKRDAGQSIADIKIVKLVLRDGIWVFAFVSGMWPNALFSFITCRIIMNLQQLKLENVAYRSPQWYIGQSPSDIELPQIL
ncbi:hypothetical protein BDQ17DRAFT_1330961 [Cyathus striatus]|nr:hypothetical protein BDQ17DRAFT_1330961 [Cyathus striatus]